jgi:hypothetical protein
MQRDALSIASPRFVEQPDLQSIQKKKNSIAISL